MKLLRYLSLFVFLSNVVWGAAGAGAGEFMDEDRGSVSDMSIGSNISIMREAYDGFLPVKMEDFLKETDISPIFYNNIEKLTIYFGDVSHPQKVYKGLFSRLNRLPNLSALELLTSRSFGYGPSNCILDLSSPTLSLLKISYFSLTDEMADQVILKLQSGSLPRLHTFLFDGINSVSSYRRVWGWVVDSTLDVASRVDAYRQLLNTEDVDLHYKYRMLIRELELPDEHELPEQYRLLKKLKEEFKIHTVRGRALSADLLEDKR